MEPGKECILRVLKSKPIHVNKLSSHLEVAFVCWILSETESESRPRNFQSLMGGGLTSLRQRMTMLLRSGQAERLLRREKTGAEEVTRSLVTEMTAVNLSSLFTSETSTCLWPRGIRPTEEENLIKENSWNFDYYFPLFYFLRISLFLCNYMFKLIYLSEESVHKDPGLEFQILDPRARWGWTLSWEIAP